MEANKAVVNRLKRLEGQIGGIAKMIEQEKPCDEILTQLAAARSALDKIGLVVISQRMRECLKSDVFGENAVEKAIEVFQKHAEHIK